MEKTQREYKGIFFTKDNKSDFSMVGDAISSLMKDGFYQDLWKSPQFREVNQLSQHLVKSATLLKKYLPERFQEYIRFTQNPNTWFLVVDDKDTADILSSILNENYLLLKDESELPQFLKLRRVYRNWDKVGELLSNTIDTIKNPQIQQLVNIIPENIQKKIRLQYSPSIWQLNVENASIATRINPLLDNLSLLLAKNMGFAPKLKLSVVPNNWKTSGFILTELVKQTPKVPTEEEAEIFLTNFLSSNVGG